MYEAAAHSRAATASFLAIHAPNGEDHQNEDKTRVFDECRRFGVGLLTFGHPADYETYEVHIEPERRSPDPTSLNRFLITQLPEEARKKIQRWLK